MKRRGKWTRNQLEQRTKNYLIYIFGNTWWQLDVTDGQILANDVSEVLKSLKLA
jgi:hypothetical protein